MEFVFGSAFVCKDMDTAKKVTFDEQVMKKSVTLDGDSFDPSGTLTGGNFIVLIPPHWICLMYLDVLLTHGNLSYSIF